MVSTSVDLAEEIEIHRRTFYGFIDRGSPSRNRDPRGSGKPPKEGGAVLDNKLDNMTTKAAISGSLGIAANH
jgi:hypothetical protein